MSRMSASPASKRYGCRARRPTSGAAAPAGSSRASATGCGTSRRRRRWSLMASRKSSPPTCPRWCSTSPNGASPIRPRWCFSTRRRRPRSARRVRCSPISAPSTVPAASPPRARRSTGCRCRRGWRAWCSMPAAKAPVAWRPRSPPCCPSAASAATTSICATGSTGCAGTAPAAPTRPAAWRGGGRRARGRLAGRAG